MKKALNVISDILVAVILIFSIVMTVMVISSTLNDDLVPSLFGYAILNVETDSMSGEDGFDPGALIIIKTLEEEETDNLKVGDVITYRRVYNGAYFLDTHRIVEITPNIVNANVGRSNLLMNEIVDGVWVHGGVRYYITKGDNTVGIDYQENGDINFAHSGNILGVWTGIQIPKLGSVMKFLQSQLGFMICVVVPVALFFIYELYVFIITISRKKKEEALAEISNKEEELKAKAVAEFLASQQAENTVATAPAEPEKPEAPANDMSEEEKQRIINEYLKKQAQENKE